MKKIFTVFMFTTLSVLMSSCMRTIYTSQQVMDMMKTKEDVITKFGLPTDEKYVDGYTEWFYFYGTASVEKSHSKERSHSNTSIDENGINDYAQRDGYSNNVILNSTRYVKFTFDSNGKVIGGQNQGVDLTVKEKDKKATTGAIIGGSALFALLIILGETAM